eukprot:TRINITY_DN17046_c0_g4_i1.p1 TRINITY_DN17046_c0_g4~~TRINITY_DN17046_c0_g4_i1.p1  ORF type:complete len:617 (+),score=177.69 TRINITY_DN17046_c0_g4_i1:114-1964(+)
MTSKFDEVLLRAERLIQSCEMLPPEQWPPERPPATPQLAQSQALAAGVSSVWTPPSPVRMGPRGCPACGNVHMADALFCRKCGKKRELSPTVQAVGPEDASSSTPAAVLASEPIAVSAPAPASWTQAVHSSFISHTAESGTSHSAAAQQSSASPGACAAVPTAGSPSPPREGSSSTACASDAQLSNLRMREQQHRLLLQQPPSSQRGSIAAAAVAAAPGPVQASGVLGSVSALRPSETAVLLDGLERENALLRQQLERCLSREKVLQTEAEELRHKLEEQDKRSKQDREAEALSVAKESERLKTEVWKQGELTESMAARLEALQTDHDAQDARLAALQAEMLNAQAEVGSITKEIESVQKIVLPHAAVSRAVEQEPAMQGGSAAMQASLRGARHALGQLRLACEAKFETLGLLHQQLRVRLENRAANGFSPPTQAAQEQASKPALPAGGTEGKAAASTCHCEQLKADLQQASRQLDDFKESQLRATKELETVRNALRVREVEVRELQLIGKYFAGQEQVPTAKDLEVAELAEELRRRCEALGQEVGQLRSERDLLRAERDSSQRTGCRVPGLPSLRYSSSSGAEDLAGAEIALALRIVDHKADPAPGENRTAPSGF